MATGVTPASKLSVDDIAVPDAADEPETLRDRLDRIEDKAELAIVLAVLALAIIWAVTDKARP